MASSSSNPHITLEVEEEYTYPYPSNVYTPSFVTLKLSGKDKYNTWKTQILCLLESHGMLGFIDGTFLSPQTSGFGKEKVGDTQSHRSLWRRSDALVKGWILGSLSETNLINVVERLTQRFLHQEGNHADDFSAKDVWDELHTMYTPAVLVSEDKQEEEIEKDSVHERLHQTISSGDRYYAKRILEEHDVTVLDKISKDGSTALHAAVANTTSVEVLELFLERIPEGTQLSNVRNSDGSTTLHVAAIIGHLEAAKMLVRKDPDLLLAKDNQGKTPLFLALSNMRTETAQHLLQCIESDAQNETLFSGASGDELVATVISSKDFRLADDMLQRHEGFHSDAVLMAIAQNFPRTPNSLLWQIAEGRLTEIADNAFIEFLTFVQSFLPRCLHGGLEILINLLFFGPLLIVMIANAILAFLVVRFYKPYENYNAADEVANSACRHLLDKNKFSGSYHHYYTNPIFEATRQNAYYVVYTIGFFFPNAMLCANEDGHTIIQYAVINRSELVYSLLLQLSGHRNLYQTIKDTSRNNLLHLAAKLAPSDKLNLISGAALQLQRELQWFKEVKGYVSPLSIIEKNSSNETPKMVFTREHADLVIQGEKWMKATAESYTITAALIITIVFAAAITVPGGSNQETGIPIFTNKAAFTIFAISDAISLFTAVTSLLMFLSILTARFSEQDFLFRLPTKLIIGLTTLFISTTAMIVAFSATLYLVFGQRNSWILIPIVVLTCLPITSFVTLQFPLILELMSATYGRSIFLKKVDLYMY